MKKFVITAIAAAGLGMALAAPASADQDSFITTLANDGIESWHRLGNCGYGAVWHSPEALGFNQRRKPPVL